MKIQVVADAKKASVEIFVTNVLMESTVSHHAKTAVVIPMEV